MASKTESSGTPGVQVVEPGSSADPFKEGGTANVTEGQDATGTTETPVSQPDEDEELTPDEDRALEDEIKGIIETKVQERIRAIQSGADKKVSAVEKELKELRGELRKSQREAQVANMTDDERATYKARFDLEDERDNVKTQKEAVDEYRKVVEMLRLTTQYGRYGVTQDMLEGCETPEDMELLAEKTRADFLESGGKPGAVPAKKTPAGATQKTDLGGAPGAQETGKLSLERGVDKMAGNIKSLFGRPGNQP